MKKLFIILLFSSLLTKSFGQIAPKTIDNAISFFEKEWAETQLQDFKNESESDAVTKLHMSIGMWIRNNWIRTENDSLKKQFNELGIFHPDDMSSIILTSLHRKLKNIPIDLKGQAQHYIDYWKPIIDRDEKSRKKAMLNYNKFKVGDEVKIYMQTIQSGGGYLAVINEGDDNWVFNPKKDLKITGIITKKFFINSDTNVFFKLRIIKKNFSDIPVLMQTMKIGKQYDFHIDKLRIE